MTKKYDVIVYVGRFQPLHNAHLRTIELASQLAEKVVVVIGSANEPHTLKNPFTVAERATLIYEALFMDSSKYEGNVYLASVENNPSDTLWAASVVEQVETVAGPLAGKMVGKIGYIKDAGVQKVMDLFPQWTYVTTPRFEPLDATHVRDIIFSDKNTHFLDGVVPPATKFFVDQFRKTEEFAQLMREKQFIADYKKQYESLRYPPIFVTADAVVMQSGHVLLVKRKAEPGKGLWALPGGFVNANTDASVEDAAIRELTEETQIKVAERILRKCIKHVKVFDAIDRSARGRTITHAFGIYLDDGFDFPKTKASDDAEDTQWIHVNDIKREMMFDDHYDIIQYFKNRSK